MDQTENRTTKDVEIQSAKQLPTSVGGLTNSSLKAFPEFEPLCEKHRQSIETFASYFPPHSSFNFTNLRAWDIRNNRKVCVLNDNIVFLLSNYDTGGFFLTLHGHNDISRTLKTLFDFAEAEDISPHIRFISEETMLVINQSEFDITEDRPNFEYIYSTEQIASLNGTLFKEKRQLAQRFEREHPNAKIAFLNLENKDVQNSIWSLFDQWKNTKGKNQNDFDNQHEKLALARILNEKSNQNLFLTAVLENEKIIAFSIDEALPHQHSISHFAKADTNYRGIYEHLNKNAAKYLISQNIKWWNWQQDLGIGGLRQVKLSYRPINILKKYTVSSNKMRTSITTNRN